MMKFTLPLLLWSFVGPIALVAQYSKQYDDCLENADAQFAMLKCASEEAARTDAALNAIYRTLISATASQPKVVLKIKAMETAWIAYRDAYIEAMWPADDKQLEYGSIYPMEANLLLARLTRQQIKLLKDLLKRAALKQ